MDFIIFLDSYKLYTKEFLFPSTTYEIGFKFMNINVSIKFCKPCMEVRTVTQNKNFRYTEDVEIGLSQGRKFIFRKQTASFPQPAIEPLVLTN